MRRESGCVGLGYGETVRRRQAAPSCVRGLVSVRAAEGPLSTVLMLRAQLCQRHVCPHEAPLGHVGQGDQARRTVGHRAVAAPERRRSALTDVKGQQVYGSGSGAHRKARSPHASYRWWAGRAEHAGETTLRASLQRRPPPGEDGGALRLKPVGYDEQKPGSQAFLMWS